MTSDRLIHLGRFYSMLDVLEQRICGARTLGDCSGRPAWPVRGVYFFREKREARSDSGAGPRVVRVGTHGSQSRLWTRLSQHRGQSGGGNHRGSIFRLLLGTALIDRDRLDFPSWGYAIEQAERAVGELLG